MIIRKVLFFLPLLLILFLFQSYFWVPTYERQTRGNPERLNKYITASIGDASQLNPVLSADTASSEIESMVFEGLIDLDENLRYRGRLATSWKVYEEAFFYLNEKALIPDLGQAGPEEVVNFILETKEGNLPVDPDLKDILESIREISMIPPKEFSVLRQEKGKKGENDREVKIQVKAPARIRMVLDRVDQELFEKLSRLLGEDYFRSFRAEEYLSFNQDVNEGPRTKYALELLPEIEHNPIVLFHLRPGVKFHDGHIFDAYDVKFTYEAIMNPKNLSPRISDYEPVKRVEVVDPLTIRIVYKRLYSPALGTWAMGILPEHLLNKKALKEEAIRSGKDPKEFGLRQSSFSRNPVGCGPFIFREWKSDQYITLDRNNEYWEGPPNFHNYLFRVIPDWLTQEMEFYAGSLDSYGGGNPPSGIPPHQVERLGKDPRYQSFSGPRLGYTYIGYNMRRKPFDDSRVRRALGMAIDVSKIIKYLLYGQGERITGPFVKQTDYYNHNILPLAYDPQAALNLLKEAGWIQNRDGWLEKDGKRLQFTLITNSGNDKRKAILAIVQDVWKQIGVDVRTDLLEWSVFIQERVDKADFDALILGWSMGIEPDLYQIWHSSQTNPYQLNFVGFKNKEADDLIIKIRQEYDHDKQVELSHRLHEIIAKEQPYTFLYVQRWTAILDKRIAIKEFDDRGDTVYKKIRPIKTGDFSYYFNQWVKLPKVPNFAP